MFQSRACSLLGEFDGVFDECVEQLPSLSSLYTENCLYDVCRGAADVHEAVCGVYSAFEIECERYGIDIEWREQTGCCK